MNHHMYAWYPKISETTKTPIVVGTSSRQQAQYSKIGEKSQSLTHNPIYIADGPTITIDLFGIHAIDCSDKG